MAPTASLRRAALLLVTVCALLGGCVADAEAPDGTVVVGIGSRPEQEVLGALVVSALERAGLTVETRTDLGGTVGLRREATGERIDVFTDYTGAAWTLGLREQAPAADPVESWERVREADGANGLRWLSPSGANATFALVVRAEDVPGDAEPTMSWLAGELSSGERSLCADTDFLVRPGGLDALAGEYAIDVARLPRLPADEKEAVAAVESGRCFAGLVTATSGSAREAGLVPVTEDLQVFPAFVVAPVVRVGSPGDDERVTAALEAVMARLDTGTLARLNAEHEGGGDVEALAERFLDEVLDTQG